MQNLPANIYSVAAVRETDRTTIEDHGVPGYTLMTRAGEAAVREAMAMFPDTRRWQIVCGAGNNGGDGYVVARLAALEGIAASVLTLVDPDKLAGDAATAYGDFAAEGGDDSGGHGLAKAERVADRDDEIAHIDAVRIAEFQGAQIVRFDLEQGDIGLRIAATQFRF